MSNINNEQLFTELTPAEGANVSGGTRYYDYYIGNKTEFGVNYSINGVKEYLEPGKERFYHYEDDPVVKYDSKIGPGYWEEKRYLEPGKNNFDRNGRYLFLGTGSDAPVPNVK